MSEIAIGDLLRAFGRLRPSDGGTQSEICRLLGFDPEVLFPSMPATGALSSLTAETEIDVPLQAGAGSGAAMSSETDDASLPRHTAYGPTLPSRLSQVGNAPLRVPTWFEEAASLPTPQREPALASVLEPLLDPLRTRAILSSALATTALDGPLDLEKVVRTLAEGRVFGEVPRRARPTLAGGVQVLVDRSDALLPFAADVKWLLARIADVVGSVRLSVLRVEGSPLQVVARRRRTDYEKHLPASGTVVVALSELGIAEGVPRPTGVPTYEWPRLARRLRRHGCLLRAFVPYPQERWPVGLSRHLRIFPWDRTTGVHDIHRLLAAETTRIGASKS